MLKNSVGEHKQKLMIMELEPGHIDAFGDALNHLFHKDFCPYLDLKSLLGRRDEDSRDRFEELYTDYYQLRIGGLTEEFKTRYFEILFDPPRVGDRIDVRGIFEELRKFKNRRGLESLQFSFVSKLVGMHDESSPIYDVHVSSFTRFKPKDSSFDMDERIESALEFFEDVRKLYMAWARRADVGTILERLKVRFPDLQECHEVRLIDILVWKTGSKGLLKG